MSKFSNTHTQTHLLKRHKYDKCAQSKLKNHSTK